MLLDALLQFDPAGTAITATAASTNVLDMASERDMGVAGRILDVFIVVQEAFTAVGAATLQVAIQGAPDNAGAPGTWADLVMTGPIGKADLLLGAELLKVALPYGRPHAGVTKNPRFYRLNYTVATGPFTAGKVQALLVERGTRPAQFAYPSGLTGIESV